LHTVDLGANEGSELVNLGLLGEKIWESGIGVFAMVIVLKGLEGRISG
jgi:hypothetical protein